MQPSRQTISQIFQQEKRYVVPLFQRAYVWNLDDQWQPLWEDVERQARLLERRPGQENAGPNTYQGTHFLGAIVVQVDPITRGRVPKTVVIDGQQRLTTFQILLCAIRDYLRETSHEYAARFERLTQNPDYPPEQEDHFKVWPTNADRSEFTRVMSAGSPSAIRTQFGLKRAVNWGLPPMALAYMYFREAFVAYIEAEDESEEATVAVDEALRDARIEAVHLALQAALQVVVIELEANDDPQIIFETLNARGQPLLPSDLIKNSVFLEAGGGNKAESWYERYWKHFDTERETKDPESRFWHATTGLVRPARPHIDVFFYTLLIEQTARDVNVSQLYSEFKQWRRLAQNLSTENLLELIKERSDIFRKVLLGGLHPRVDEFFSRLRSLDTISPVPVVLHLLSRGDADDAIEQTVQCVTDIESFLVRRMFCRKSSKSYGSFFIGLLKAIKDVPTSKLAIALRRYLLTAPGVGNRPWPDNETFRAGWLEHKVYVKSRSDRAAMVLRAIELDDYTVLNEGPPNLQNLTVEHLLPQSAALTHYPFAEVPLFAEYPPQEKRDLLIHTIGNLTLLTQALNSTVSNGPFPQKCAAIGQNSSLRLNAPFRGGAIKAWNEKSVVQRSEALFDRAKAIWPYPAA